MLKEILERIDARLAVVELKEAPAAIAAGLGIDAIRNIRRAVRAGEDRKGISTNTLIALAPVLQTTAAWLLDGSGNEEMPTRRLREALIEASHLPDEIQDRIADFTKFEIDNHARRDTAA